MSKESSKTANPSRICKNGHNLDVVGTNRARWCRQCCREYHKTRKRREYAELKENILLTTGGFCEICLNKGKKLVIDHDHKTGVNRGLLCRSCNIAIGLIKEDKDILGRIEKYLSKEENLSLGLHPRRYMDNA